MAESDDVAREWARLAYASYGSGNWTMLPRNLTVEIIKAQHPAAGEDGEVLV